MLRIFSQPIVNVLTGQTVMEECLSRPVGISTQDYFSMRDRNQLLRRELYAVLQSIDMEDPGIPFNVNVTPYSLPHIAKLQYISWNGGLEIVEWLGDFSSYFASVKEAIKMTQDKGMMIWADDITPRTLDMWLKAGVDGVKVELYTIRRNPVFLDKLLKTGKPLIVERIETREDHEWIKNQGVEMAQGYYYGRPAMPLKKVYSTVG